MKRVLLLCLHRPNRSPSQRFRIEQYIPFLEHHGYSFTYSYLLDEKDDKIFYQPGHYLGKLGIVVASIAKRVSEIAKASSYDLVFVQREAFMLGTAFFESAIGGKAPMIFDFDDSIWLQNVSESNRKLAFLKDASKTSKIIEKAALVFAGNDYLASYARKFNRNTVVIPTTIETDKYVKGGSNGVGQVCIGWTGSFSTIEHFLLAVPALKSIREKYGSRVRFKVIGDGNFYSPELDVKGIPWKAATEIEDLQDIDIGIMPLPDTEWAKGKCGLKGLQYMAMGIATLMSPVGVNSVIIRHGENGFLPASEDEWVQQLSLLIDDESRRRNMAAAGRQTVQEEYSVSVWRDQYLEHFNRVTRKN